MLNTVEANLILWPGDSWLNLTAVEVGGNLDSLQILEIHGFRTHGYNREGLQRFRLETLEAKTAFAGKLVARPPTSVQILEAKTGDS